MRLLHTTSLQLSEVFGAQIPEYAIVSHTWEEEEVTFQDMQRNADPAVTSKKGYIKVLNSCRQARSDEFEWIWVDTCCIDKTSSSELSEAINSMYQWYQDARRCYVFLSDVDRDSKTQEELHEAIRQCRWFTRGWTLQELIAPPAVDFFDYKWRDIGSNRSLVDLLHSRTGIRRSILLREQSMMLCSAGERMSWAAERETTREEDKAYSLLGIFRVHMPLLYGEGGRAFLRLQEEIIRQAEDYSLLLWSPPVNSLSVAHRSVFQTPFVSGVIAANPDNFGRRLNLFVAEKQAVQQLDWSAVTYSLPKYGPATLSSRGLKVTLLAKKSSSMTYLAWTFCRFGSDLICVQLMAASGHTRNFRRYGAVLEVHPADVLKGMEPMELELSLFQMNDRTGISKLKATSIFMLRLNLTSSLGGNTGPSPSVKLIETYPGWIQLSETEPNTGKFSWYSTLGDMASDKRSTVMALFLCQYSFAGTSEPFIVVLGSGDSQMWCTILTDYYEAPLEHFAVRLGEEGAGKWTDRCSITRKVDERRQIWIRVVVKLNGKAGTVTISVDR